MGNDRQRVNGNDVDDDREPGLGRMGSLGLAGVGLVMALSVGCRGGPRRQAEMVSAIDEFYVGEPACLWFEPVELPVEVDAADAQGRDGLEALVGQGLLIRTKIDADEVSPAGMRYELTDRGRAAWHPDAGHVGFGNICYGSTVVVEVGSMVARRDAVFGDVMDVAYLTQLKHPPPWTMSPAVKEAFPRLKMELTGPMPGSAVLRKTANGWGVAGGPVYPATGVGGGYG